MPTTTYTIAGEGLEAQTRSSKQSAIKVADALRSEHKVTVTVTTGAGTEVYVTKARKQGKGAKPFTRVDARDFAKLLGEGVEIPEGFVVAYQRPRTSLALLRADVEDGFAYLVMDLATGGSTEAANTRDGGKIMSAVRKGDLELAV
jgi:hypothetical protein